MKKPRVPVDQITAVLQSDGADVRVDQSPSITLTFLFVASGAAALIYEIVWFQLLQLVVGSSSISLGILLATFMGGMCVGSLVVPKLAAQRHHPLRVYAALELGIGVLGLLILALVPLIGGAYFAIGGGYLGRGVVAALCLFPPTFLMGATLPAAARWNGSSTSSAFLYAANVVGAVIGTLLAGFYLLRVFDTAVATYVAVLLNVLIAVAAFAMSARTARHATEDERALIHPPPRDHEPLLRLPSAIYIVSGISGFCALSAEVLWTRHLALLFGGSVYTLSLILAAFLTGIGIGSAGGAALGTLTRSPRALLGWSQLLSALAICWAAYMLGSSLPYWPIFSGLSTSIWFEFQLDLFRALWTVLPASVLWGASFSFALSCIDANASDRDVLVGRLYSANTFGALLGALATSLVLVAAVGSQRVQQILVALSIGAGVLALAGGARSLNRGAARVPGFRIAAPLIVIAGTLVLLVGVPPVSKWLIAYGRFAPRFVDSGEVIYSAEGVHDSLAVTKDRQGGLYYSNSGKVQASTQLQDMRLQRMLAHLTTLIPQSPSRVLVIGYGAGVTAGAIAVDPRVREVTIAEIEPLVPLAVTRFFGNYNLGVDRNPKVTVRVDDGRHYLATSGQRFDAISSDMLDPWVKGTAMLFTREFFDLARSHLNPGGVMTLFVQLYQTDKESVRSTLATFFEVFPDGLVFGNTHEGEGYDLVLIGSPSPIHIDPDAIMARLQQRDHAIVSESLRAASFPSALDLLVTYAGRGRDLEPWLKGASINRDRNLRLQYLAGFGMNTYENSGIYRELVSYRRFPHDVFTGPPRYVDILEAAQRALTPAPAR